jgi:hypothetical protein
MKLDCLVPLIALIVSMAAVRVQKLSKVLKAVTTFGVVTRVTEVRDAGNVKRRIKAGRSLRKLDNVGQEDKPVVQIVRKFSM